MFSGAAGQLALAGSAAGNADGTFDVARGMRIVSPDGEKIGKVREVITDSRGKVQELIVKVDGETARIPASNFTGSGSVLISGMTEGQIKNEADRQENAPAE